MIALAVPVVLSELGWMAHGVVDTIMVGRLGAGAIASVALGCAVYYPPSLFGLGLLLGLDTLVSQAYGRGDYDECHRWMAQGIYLAIIITPPLMIAIALASFGLAPLGIGRELAQPAAGYLRVVNWGTPPLLIYFGTRRYLQAVGDSRVVTITLLVSNVLNWFGNWVLIQGKLGMPALGIRGSALATVASRLFIALVLLGFAWRHERQRGHPLFRRWAAPNLMRLKELTRLSAPAAGQLLLEVGAWNVVTISAGWLTPAVLATHQIALNYVSLTYMVPLGIASAAAVSVGHAVGAGDMARARRDGWLALGLATAFMLLAAAVFFTFPVPLIALYTREPAVLAVGPSLLGLAAAFEIFDGIQAVSTGALRGLGQTRTPMLANLVGYWALGLPLGLVLCFTFHRGVYGLWIGLTVALIAIASTLLASWKRHSRIKESVQTCRTQ